MFNDFDITMHTDFCQLMDRPFCSLSITKKLVYKTNRKSDVADRSVSVLMTLSDLERRGVMGRFSGRSP